MNSLEVIKHINTPEVSEKILRRAVALNRGGSTKDSPKSSEKTGSIFCVNDTLYYTDLESGPTKILVSELPWRMRLDLGF